MLKNLYVTNLRTIDYGNGCSPRKKENKHAYEGSLETPIIHILPLLLLVVWNNEGESEEIREGMFPLGQIVLVVSHMHICEAIIASLWMLFASCLAVRSLSKRKVFFPFRMEADSKLGRGPSLSPWTKLRMHAVCCWHGYSRWSVNSTIHSLCTSDETYCFHPHWPAFLFSYLRRDNHLISGVLCVLMARWRCLY